MDHSFGGSVHDHLAPWVCVDDDAKSSSGREKLVSWSGLTVPSRHGSVDLKISC